MDKIYSRKRIRIPKIRFFFSNNNRSNNKLFKILAIVTIITLIIGVIIDRVMPAIKILCNDKAMSIGNKICNDAVNNSVSNLTYDDLITYKQDTDGNITMIKANSINMNKLASQITTMIQKDLDDLDKSSIKIPLGSLTNNQFLYGTGPNIEIKVASTGKVDVNFESEFISAGINQTIHRVYLSIHCKIYILGSFIMNTTGVVESKIPIAETIIVGNIPSSYYNLEGLTVNDTVKLIDN